MTRESSRRLRKSRKAKVEALPTSEFNARMIVDGIPGLVELVSADAWNINISVFESSVPRQTAKRCMPAAYCNESWISKTILNFE